ncbi:MAG: hypothetical protein ACRCX2_38055 [Paraclostridium sp.]
MTINRVVMIEDDYLPDLEDKINEEIRRWSPQSIEYKMFPCGEYHCRFKYIAILTY